MTDHENYCTGQEMPAPMPVEKLRGVLGYDPDTGGFRWLVDRGCNFHRMRAGSAAGTVNSYGYVVIKIGGRFYKGHRLAWYLAHGEWPPRAMEIDHINRVKGDNRLCNLRLVSKSENLRNCRPRPCAIPKEKPSVARRRFGRGTIKPEPMPVSDLRAMLAYDRYTGVITWKACPAGGQGAVRVKPGTAANCHNAFGYIVIRINRVLYQAGRIAWFLETSEWPSGEIDHRNNIRDDNRFENLRVATSSENSANRRATRPNTSGYRGVHKLRNGWVGRIMINGKLVSLPFRATAEEAHADYVEAATKKYGAFARFHI